MIFAKPDAGHFHKRYFSPICLSRQMITLDGQVGGTLGFRDRKRCDWSRNMMASPTTDKGHPIWRGGLLKGRFAKNCSEICTRRRHIVEAHHIEFGTKLITDFGWSTSLLSLRKCYGRSQGCVKLLESNIGNVFALTRVHSWTSPDAMSSRVACCCLSREPGTDGRRRYQRLHSI
jgi:hypothetical protein